jgi:hypothetical protein
MEEINDPPIIENTPSQRTVSWFKSEAALRAADLLAGAIAIALIFWWLQYSTNAICCGDYDGYYHIKWARLLWDNMRAHHFPPGFPWLPLTSLNARNYVDHHLLYHIILIPFTWFRDLQTGAKVSAILFASIAVFSCYWLVVRYEIRYRLVWLLAILACSAPFLYRMNMTKAPPFAIIFLVLGTYFLFEKKPWPLLPLAFVFTLTYDMFVLLLIGTVIWAIVIGWTEERFEWRPLVFVLGGSILGLIINPYFPHNLYLLYEHARMKITAGEFPVKVGQEWDPYSTFDFLMNCYVALAAMLAGYLAFDFSDRKRAQRPLYLLILSTVLMLMTARSRRFAEYFPPFAILFAAFALESFWQGRAIFSRLPQDMLADLEPFLDRQETAEAQKEKRAESNWLLFKGILVSLALGAALFANVYRTSQEIRGGDSRDHYEKGAMWMRANIPAGEMVFNTDWDDFPRLFYYDPTHVYTSGLDPSYLHDKDPDLSDLYVKITTGDQEDPGPLIRDKFGARWVFSDNTTDHDSFYDRALSSGWFDRVYEDADCSVLHLRDQKAQPPTEEKKDDKDKAGDDDNSP